MKKLDERLRFEALLAREGNLYSFDDIMSSIQSGDMQGFTDGETWVVTSVVEYPQKKVLHVLYVLGNLDGVKALEPRIIEFAKNLGATMMMASGRLGWLKRVPMGWKSTSVSWHKEI